MLTADRNVTVGAVMWCNQNQEKCLSRREILEENILNSTEMLCNHSERMRCRTGWKELVTEQVQV